MTPLMVGPSLLPHPSPSQTLFSSYFRSSGGVQYLQGGVASGFNHVERDVYETTLLHIKGKRNTRTKQVPVSVASLNQGDVFILDLGLKLFLVRATQHAHLPRLTGACSCWRLDAAAGRC